MKKSETVVFGFLFLLLAGLLFALPLRAAQELVPIYTPPAGGTAYVLGAGIATVTNKFLPDAYIVHEGSTGTMEMVRKMMQRQEAKKPCFAVFGAPDAWNAYKGNNEYKGRPFTGVRAVAFVNDSDQYFVVPAKSPIKSFADVKGKRLGIGGPGSTVSTSFLLVLEYYGITKKDFKPYYYTYKEALEGIQDGSLDGGLVGGGYPVSAYVELSTIHNVRIVPVDEEILRKVSKDHPYFYRNVVKAKSYRGIEQDTTIYGFTSAIFTHSGVSDDFVYKFTRNLFEHRNDYYAIHRSAKDLTPETATKGIPVPFHPGAEKYLREISAFK